MPYWMLFFHITWGTKNRLSLITPGFEASLHSAIAAKAIELGAIVHAVGGIEDHVQWQEEYGIHSFGEKDLRFIVGYIKGQHEHHRQGKTLENLERVD